MAAHRLRHCEAEADIDRLRADIRGDCHGWRLTVRYEIEIEDARRGEAFELLLNVYENGRPVTDEHGRVMTVVVPLDCPSDVDDDEVEFEGKIRTEFTKGAISCPRSLKLRGKVVPRGHGAVLDEKCVKVDCD